MLLYLFSKKTYEVTYMLASIEPILSCFWLVARLIMTENGKKLMLVHNSKLKLHSEINRQASFELKSVFYFKIHTMFLDY